METLSNVLDTTVCSIGDGAEVTVLQIAIALLTPLVGVWLARWVERRISQRLERRQVDAGVVIAVAFDGMTHLSARFRGVLRVARRRSAGTMAICGSWWLGALIAFGGTAAQAEAADSAVVLMYHRFAEDSFPSTSIRLEQFVAQLEHLEERGYNVIPLADLVAAFNGDSVLPERAVVITIDDAYRSIYTVAHKRFRKFGFPYTVFVATDSVDEGLAAYMSWEEMRELEAEGATFANHGAAHRSTIEEGDFTSEDERLALVRDDVDKGWRRLGEELNPLAGVYAYPYGEYDAKTAELLKNMGYISFGQQSGAISTASDTRSLARFPMAESFGGMDQFPTKVASLPMPVVEVEPWDPVVTTRSPEITVSLGDTDARIGELACFVSGQGRVEVDWQEPERRFSVGANDAFTDGRHRVNCTAPHNSGRYLWFSHPWVVRPSPETN
jgi:peptidoglycan/xylan/chitin deacetylase (PgdA/CDA1 family)